MATTPNCYRQSSKSIPEWMLSVDRVLARKPVASMRSVGVPSGWMDTWETLALAIKQHGPEIASVVQAIQLAEGDWPPELMARVRRATTEPLCAPQTSVHLISTGRGLLMVVAPQGPLWHHMQDSVLHVHPWGRPDLPGTTQCRWETEQLDPAPGILRPWLWAAMKAKILLAVTPPPASPEGLEVTIPDYLAMQAARQVRRRV